MGIKCHIFFDNSPEGTFYSGSVITGKVEIILDKQTSVRGIAIKFFGRAKTNWTEGSGDDTINKSGQIDYLSSLTYLIGSDIGNTVVIEPGIQTFNFSCALPSQLPSSFEGSHGSIRYSVQVIFDRPWKFDKTYTVGITILKMVDLNSNDSAVIRIPSEYQTSEKYWCGPCTTNPLDIRIKLPQLGYVPGQAIIVYTSVQNNTKINIEHVQMSLIKSIKYYSDDLKSDKNESITIVELKTEPVKQKSSKIFQEFIRIPAIPPTCMNLCKIIQISYNLLIKIKVHGFHKSPIIKFPISIGNIPLAEIVTQQPLPTISRSVNNTSNNNTLPVIDNIPVDSIPTIAQDCHISPPSYQEAIYMNKVNLSKNETHPICDSPEYVPKYPVYNFNPIAPSLDEIDTPKYESNGIWI